MAEYRHIPNYQYREQLEGQRYVELANLLGVTPIQEHYTHLSWKEATSNLREDLAKVDAAKDNAGLIYTVIGALTGIPSAIAAALGLMAAKEAPFNPFDVISQSSSLQGLTDEQVTQVWAYVVDWYGPNVVEPPAEVAVLGLPGGADYVFTPDVIHRSDDLGFTADQQPTIPSDEQELGIPQFEQIGPDPSPRPQDPDPASYLNNIPVQPDPERDGLVYSVQPASDDAVVGTERPDSTLREMSRDLEATASDRTLLDELREELQNPPRDYDDSAGQGVGTIPPTGTGVPNGEQLDAAALFGTPLSTAGEAAAAPDGPSDSPPPPMPNHTPMERPDDHGGSALKSFGEGLLHHAPEPASARPESLDHHGSESQGSVLGKIAEGFKDVGEHAGANDHAGSTHDYHGAQDIGAAAHAQHDAHSGPDPTGGAHSASHGPPHGGPVGHP